MKRTLKLIVTFSLCVAMIVFLPVVAKAQATQGQAAPSPGQSGGPSYSDTVKWVEENIKSAGVPVRSNTQTGITFVCTARNSKGECADGYHDNHGYTVTSSGGYRYSVEVDGCNSLIVVNTYQFGTASTDAGSGNESSSDNIVSRWKLPFASIDHVAISSQKVKLPDLSDESHPIGSPAPPPYDPGLGWKVYVIMKDESGTYDRTSSLFDGHTTGQITAKDFGGMPSTVLPGIGILFGLPGAEDTAPHMVKALQHLVDICKAHPEQAPKPMF